METLINCWIVFFVGIHLWAFLSPSKPVDSAVEKMWNDNF